MEKLAYFFARVVYHLIALFSSEMAEKWKRERLIKEEGARAEADREKSVSEYTREENIDFGTPDIPAPIKEGKHVPTKKEGSGLLSGRRGRKRP